MPETLLPLPARVSVALARGLLWIWPTGAAWAYGDAIRWAPETPDLFFRQGDAFSRARRWDAAAQAFAGAARLRPRAVEYQASLVAALHHAGRADELVSALRRLVELRPDEGELSVLLGAVLLRQGRPVEALRAFRWAVRLSPGHQRRRFVLGETLLGPGGWQQALASWHGASRIDAPDPGIVHAEPGRSLLQVHPGKSRVRVVGRRAAADRLPGLLTRVRGRWERLSGLMRQSVVQKVTGDEREQRVRALRRAWQKANPRTRWLQARLSLRRRAKDASA